MNSLFSQPTQVENLIFTTFLNDYVAERYGVSEATIRSHKKLHADEILENVHFVTQTNKYGTNEVKWTLRGIIKLGMFIRSKEAKNFRLWAEMELEKSIRTELENARLTRERNLKLVNQISALETGIRVEAKHYQDQINGYLGKLAAVNKSNEVLKAELVLANDKLTKLEQTYHAEVIEKHEAKYESLRAMLHNARCERDYYFKRFNDLKKERKYKESEIARLLNKIQNQMDGVYSEIGAVMAYANNDDRFFIENKGAN